MENIISDIEKVFAGTKRAAETHYSDMNGVLKAMQSGIFKEGILPRSYCIFLSSMFCIFSAGYMYWLLLSCAGHVCPGLSNLQQRQNPATGQDVERTVFG